jgi:hypothetical protein
VPLFMTMFRVSFTHVVVSVEIVGWYTRTGVYLTGFAGTALGASSMAGGASLSGRGVLTGGARGFCLGSEESAGMRVRLDWRRWIMISLTCSPLPRPLFGCLLFS